MIKPNRTTGAGVNHKRLIRHMVLNNMVKECLKVVTCARSLKLVFRRLKEETKLETLACLVTKSGIIPTVIGFKVKQNEKLATVNNYVARNNEKGYGLGRASPFNESKHLYY